MSVADTEFRIDNGIALHDVCLSAACDFAGSRNYSILAGYKMKRSVQDTPVVFIGAGNLATNLA